MAVGPEAKAPTAAYRWEETVMKWLLIIVFLMSSASRGVDRLSFQVIEFDSMETCNASRQVFENHTGPLSTLIQFVGCFPK